MTARCAQGHANETDREPLGMRSFQHLRAAGRRLENGPERCIPDGRRNRWKFVLWGMRWPRWTWWYLEGAFFQSTTVTIGGDLPKRVRVARRTESCGEAGMP
jgi:hypothetical protein